MDTLATTATRDGEADRQMIVLALAHLAVERPGWLWTCREMAVERFGAGPMFDSFLELHREALAVEPIAPSTTQTNDDAALYQVAKQICHDMGLPWTDPRTGETHEPWRPPVP